MPSTVAFTGGLSCDANERTFRSDYLLDVLRGLVQHNKIDININWWEVEQAMFVHFGFLSSRDVGKLAAKGDQEFSQMILFFRF